MTSTITHQIINEDEDDDVCPFAITFTLSLSKLTVSFLTLYLSLSLFRVSIGKQPLEKSMWLAKPGSPPLRTRTNLFPIFPLPIQMLHVLRPSKRLGFLGNLRSTSSWPRRAYRGLGRSIGAPNYVIKMA
jgi:hypothetical protein